MVMTYENIVIKDKMRKKKVGMSNFKYKKKLLA